MSAMISAVPAISQPKAESPFMLFPDERHQIIQPTFRTSKEEAAWLASNGMLSDMDRSILQALHVLSFATPAQILSYLAANGKLAPSSSEILQRRLLWLQEKSFVSRLLFYSSVSSGGHLPCCYLGYHGVGILRAAGLRVQSTAYTDTMESWRIKRQLSANQVLLSLLVPEMDSLIRPSPLLLCPSVTGAIVKPRYLLRQNGRACFIDAVRKTPGWTEALTEKLLRYGLVLRNYRRIPDLSDLRPCLILAFEARQDMEHFARLQTTPFSEQSSMLLTCDRAVCGSPSHAFTPADDLFPKRFGWSSLFA